MIIPTAQFLRVRWHIDMAWLAGLLPEIPRTVCEVGIGPADISIIPQFEPSVNCQHVIGVEPNPEFQGIVPDAYGYTLHCCAVGHTEGRAELVLDGGSSRILTAATKPRGLQTIDVTVRRFDAIDDGRIDVLNVDCEGRELAVLQHMRSRPKIIGIEIWPHWPEARAKRDWLEAHGYKLRITSGPEGETQVWSL